MSVFSSIGDVLGGMMGGTPKLANGDSLTVQTGAAASFSQQMHGWDDGQGASNNALYAQQLQNMYSQAKKQQNQLGRPASATFGRWDRTIGALFLLLHDHPQLGDKTEFTVTEEWIYDVGCRLGDFVDDVGKVNTRNLKTAMQRLVEEHYGYGAEWYLHRDFDTQTVKLAIRPGLPIEPIHSDADTEEFLL